MKKLTTILLTGVATLAFTACGGSSSSGGSSTPPPVEQQQVVENELPMTAQGYYQLLPGYSYPSVAGDTYQMYVKEPGNVLFTGSGCGWNVYNEGYYEYNLEEPNSYGYTNNGTYTNQTEYFEAGWYYIAVMSNCGDTSVQSNVL